MASTSEHDRLPRPGTATLRASIVCPAQFLGFWTAVLSPFLLLGIVAAGLATQHPFVVTGLLAANLAGLVVGNGYNR